jgi:hypothetical protein
LVVFRKLNKLPEEVHHIIMLPIIFSNRDFRQLRHAAEEISAHPFCGCDKDP